VHVWGPVKRPQDDQPHYGHHHVTGLVDCLSIERLSIPVSLESLWAEQLLGRTHNPIQLFRLRLVDALIEV